MGIGASPLGARLRTALVVDGAGVRGIDNQRTIKEFVTSKLRWNSIWILPLLMCAHLQRCTIFIVTIRVYEVTAEDLIGVVFDLVHVLFFNVLTLWLIMPLVFNMSLLWQHLIKTVVLIDW